jgi:orotidine-5'-phosphate decarboxylase
MGETQVADEGTAGDSSAEPEVPAEIRSALVLALDVDDLVEANRLARELRPWFGVAKVGLELYSAVGPDAIAGMSEQGFDVFADLKLYDIPTTVNRAARVMGALGVSYLTVHASGGVSMMRAAVEGLQEGAAAAGVEAGKVVAVTVLTSDTTAPSHIVPKRVALALEAGAGGLVCAAADLKEVRELAPRLTRIVPGIRPEGAPRHDQGRAATPREALDGGADLLVIGRTVTRADDHRAAAQQIVAELQA